MPKTKCANTIACTAAGSLNRHGGYIGGGVDSPWQGKVKALAFVRLMSIRETLVSDLSLVARCFSFPRPQLTAHLAGRVRREAGFEKRDKMSAWT